MKMEDAGSSTRHSFGLFWTAKKRVPKKKPNIFLREKSPFRILKSIWDNIFFKSGFIVIGVFSAFVHSILSFSYYADILIITKSRNWKQERSQVLQS